MTKLNTSPNIAGADDFYAELKSRACFWVVLLFEGQLIEGDGKVLPQSIVEFLGNPLAFGFLKSNQIL